MSFMVLAASYFVPSHLGCLFILPVCLYVEETVSKSRHIAAVSPLHSQMSSFIKPLQYIYLNTTVHFLVLQHNINVQFYFY